MIGVSGAPIGDADAQAIAEYLATAYRPITIRPTPTLPHARS
jgi:hypothetical protein